ncbi:MAG: OsmC family protein [Rubrobacter sp.]|nr:OsmC family protein [Rubrobacter sp.]
MDNTDYAWTSRVSWMGEGWATAYTRNHAFTVGEQASFREADAHPDAVEYLLGALGGDLISGFASHAARRGVEVDAMEASIFGRLNNPLVYLGVVGEKGHPGFETISCTLYASADADEETLEEIWQTTLARSPLVNTLHRCVGLTLTLHAVE